MGAVPAARLASGERTWGQDPESGEDSGAEVEGKLGGADTAEAKARIGGDHAWEEVLRAGMPSRQVGWWPP